ncbi:hypothetical protein ACFLS1_07860 [Verrucomicrobiota bacterium]
MNRIFIIILMIGLAGCATIPNGGYHGDISKLGTPGDVLATIRLGEGLLVETAQLDNNRSVNLQINKENVPETDPLYYARTLTIGKFSKIFGSGFTKRKNLYYQKRIWYNGKDVFEIDGDRYLVEWRCNYKDPLTYIITDMYVIIFRRLGEKSE